MDEDQDKTPSIEQVNGYIESQVKSYLDDWMKSEGSRTVTPTPTRVDTNKDVWSEVISPFVDPKIAQSNLKSADAKDFASFYMDNPEAHGMKQQIEKMFDDLVSKGQPHTREDIYDKIIGSSYRTNKEEFYNKETEKRQAQVNNARQAQDFGNSGFGRERNPDLEQKFAQFDKLPLAEQEQLLVDVVW